MMWPRNYIFLNERMHFLAEDDQPIMLDWGIARDGAVREEYMEGNAGPPVPGGRLSEEEC